MTLRQRLLVAAVLLPALAGQALRGWHRIESSALVRAVQRQMASIAAAGRPGIVLRASEAALVRAQRLDPAAVEPLAFHADLLFVAGRLADADRAYQRASAHEPRAEVLFNWGLVLWRQGRGDLAVVQMRRGLALAPRLADGQPPEAREAVARAPLIPIPPLVPPVPP